MISARLLNFILIIGGGILALYAQTTDNQSTLLMMIGIILLFLGIYRTAKNIPSKSEANEHAFDDTNSLGDDFDEEEL